MSAPESDDERQKTQLVPFRQLLESLIYLSTRTCPDIVTDVSLLGKFYADPTPQDWSAMKHLIRYVKKTDGLGLLIPKKSNCHGLQAWSDADWADDEGDRHARSGILVLLHGAPVISTSRQETGTV